MNGEDVKNLIDNNVFCVGEIFNMGCIFEVIDFFIEYKIMYVFGKVVNVGGVVIFGFEML